MPTEIKKTRIIEQFIILIYKYAKKFLMIDIPEKNWTVYLLECCDRTLYCGITKNLDNRLKQHKGVIPGGAKYTRSRLPLKLVYIEKSNSRSEALKRELTIKKMTRNAKLQLIRNSINSEADLNHSVPFGSEC